MYGIYDDGVLIAKFATPMTVASNQPIMLSDALSLKRTFTKRVAQRWEITSNIEPLSHEANRLFALFVKKGYTESFDVSVPQNYGALQQKTTTSTPLATGAAFSNSVTLGNNNGLLPAGTFIQFGNHPKVYVTVSARNRDGTVEIHPQLRVSVNSISVNHSDVRMPCYRDVDSVQGMTYIDGILMDLGTMKFVEQL